MREVDPRVRFSRRGFLQTAAVAAPAAALATGAGLQVSEAWAENGAALAPAELKTLVKMARDIYPHDFLGDVYYITAIKPWDGKAAADAGVKTLLTQGVRRLDEDSQARHKVDYAQIGWEADRVVILEGISHTDFFKKIRSDLVVSLYNQPELWPKFGYEGPSADKGGYINRGFNDIDWLPKV
ncbi:twin-arginine translocation signal domain-containing protein [uncultured Methylobacterium sp.]|uniref:twin-arginine translocation signal domain-containing protein n=1 Tax=uncultured Methylobacterium sp. TaxID=157278 RepID=UPI002591FCE7|nr:twin-arginine translocation signal domain-containing protein [uncultured Methylobacterium sp.]